MKYLPMYVGLVASREEGGSKWFLVEPNRSMISQQALLYCVTQFLKFLEHSGLLII